ASAAHSARGRAGLSLGPIRGETYFGSYLSPAPASPVSKQRFAFQFVGRNYEHAFRLRVGNIDDTQIPSAPRLPDSDSRTVASRPVLARCFEDILDFPFVNAMLKDVRLPGGRIEIIANIHRQPHTRLPWTGRPGQTCFSRSGALPKEGGVKTIGARYARFFYDDE